MEKKELWRNSELYVGLGMIAVFCILLWQIAIISVPESRIFPGFAAAVIGISGLSLVIRACQGKAHGDASKLRIHAKELAAFAILVVACFLFDILGFYTTLLFMLFAISLCVEYPLTRKKVAFSIVYSIIVTILCFVCFGIFLGLMTPRGVLI